MSRRVSSRSDLLTQLRAAVDDARDVVVDLCGRLVAAPSVNPPGDTRGVAAVVTEHLGQAGLAHEVLAGDPLMPNVVASVDGTAPAGGARHVVLNVHLDTMDPGDESAWSVPRYAMTRDAGRLYGLGMGNMKGAVAAALTAYRLLAARRDQWAGRLTLAAVSDECVFGDNGAAWLLAEHADRVVGDLLICGEGPGWMRLGLAEKGVAWYRLTAAGPAGHASGARRGGTAPARLAAALLAVDALNDHVVAAPADLAELAPDDTEAMRLSVGIGTVAAGTFISQLAPTATAEVDVRVPPGLSLEDLEAMIDACVAPHGVRWQRLKAWPGNYSSPADPLVRAFADAAEAVRGAPAVATVRLPASDASRWRALGVPAVCFGPQPTLSAGVDDHALEQDVLDCASTYALAAMSVLTPAPRR